MSSELPVLAIHSLFHESKRSERDALLEMSSPTIKAERAGSLDSESNSDHRKRLEQLKSHPLFNDLQVTLALDCVRSNVPYSLLTETSSTSSSPRSLDSSFTTVSDGLAKEHAVLQMMLIQLQSYFPALLTTYYQYTDQIEVQRYKALAFNSHGADASQLINWHYNRERETLINQMKVTLDTLMKKTKLLTPDAAMKPGVNLPGGLGSGLPLPSANVSSTPSTLLENVEAPLDLSGSQNKPANSNVGVQKKSRFLSKKAVSILQRWYQQHRDHPYATDEEVKDLAMAGGISHNQVKKWMANTRARSFNTLTYNGGKHMLNSKLAMKKRLMHKYKIEPLNGSSNSTAAEHKAAEPEPTPAAEDNKEELIDVETVCAQSPSESATLEDLPTRSSPEPSKCSPSTNTKPSLEQVVARCHQKSSELVSDLTQNKSVIESLQDVVKNVTSSSPEPSDAAESCSEHTASSKRYLSPKAKFILNEWFKEHEYRPYPTYEEKKELASLCGISSVRVDTWFANTRNRTHNTKKLPPKYSHLLH